MNRCRSVFLISFFLAWTSSARAFDQSALTGLLGVSADGKYASYEVIGGDGSSNTITCEVRFFETSTNQKLAVVHEEIEDNGNDSENLHFQLRKKCWAKAKSWVEKYKIEIGSSSFLQEYDSVRSTLYLQLYMNVSQYMLKIVEKRVAISPEDCVSDKKIASASFVIQKYEFVKKPGQAHLDSVLPPGSTSIPLSLPPSSPTPDCGFVGASIDKVYFFPRSAKSSRGKYLLIAITSLHVAGPGGGAYEYWAYALEVPDQAVKKPQATRPGKTG